MSSAFTKDSDDGGALPDPGERHVSPHRNLVTRHGLALIDGEIESLRQEHNQAEAEGDREKIALTSRDLRYWTARRETAELSEPEPGIDIRTRGVPERSVSRWSASWDELCIRPSSQH